MSRETEQSNTSCPCKESANFDKQDTVVSSLIIAWIGAASLFFFARFSFLFFDAHRESIIAIFQRFANG